MQKKSRVESRIKRVFIFLGAVPSRRVSTNVGTILHPFEKRLRIVSRFKNPTLWGDFKEEFIDDPNTKVIWVGSRNLLNYYWDDYKQKVALIPNKPDFSNYSELLDKGIDLKPRQDMVFALARKFDSKPKWFLKGGEYLG